MNDLELLPALILLNFRQQTYTYRNLCFSELIPTKDILLMIFQTIDGNIQPEKLHK